MSLFINNTKNTMQNSHIENKELIDNLNNSDMNKNNPFYGNNNSFE